MAGVYGRNVQAGFRLLIHGLTELMKKEGEKNNEQEKDQTVLMILDGYGLNNNQKGNAVAEDKDSGCG